MDVSRDEFKVLVSISEGMSDLDQVEIYTGFDRERVKEIFIQLEQLFFISVNRRGKSAKNWSGELLESSKLLFEKHKDWLGR